MSRSRLAVDSAAEALLAVMAARGIDYAFGNAGTDFPSLIEAFAKAAAGRARAPRPITVPHENLAVAMAHGVYLATGRPQAVMLHVNVGTANAICGLLNAARDNVPMLVFAGRTPLGEGDAPGARSVFIHWAQEMFDQAGMVREIVKWDYELRQPEQVEAVVDRALALSMSEPRGPVYLTLPREVLMAGAGEFTFESPGRHRPAAPPAPDAEATAELLDALRNAERPLLVTANLGRDEGRLEALAALAERFALPVVGYRPRYPTLPSTHPLHFGYAPGALLREADLVLVVECDVPWVPKLERPPETARVVHIGHDPLHGRYPMRSFPADLVLAGEAAAALGALAEAAQRLSPAERAGIEARRSRLATRQGERRARIEGHRAEARAAGRPTPALVADTLNRLKRGGDVLVSETQLPLDLLDLAGAGSFFAGSSAGGLGWGLGAATGVKLAWPERRVIALVGDGGYMFGNPTPAHFVCSALDLPVLTVILNNRMWGAVRRATLSLYPEGAAARANRAPLTYLEPAPDYERVVEASGGLGLRVEHAAELEPALVRALEALENERRQVVVNVLTEYSDGEALRDAGR